VACETPPGPPCQRPVKMEAEEPPERPDQGARPARCNGSRPPHVDGCNDIVILFRIILSLSKAVLSAVGLFYMVFIWNECLPGLIHVRTPSKEPVQAITVLPILLVCQFLQKHFVKGALLGSIKG
jgi:ABC-type glycerol-3-phosphate transport system permease component